MEVFEDTSMYMNNTMLLNKKIISIIIAVRGMSQISSIKNVDL